MAKNFWSLWTAAALLACLVTPAPAEICVVNDEEGDTQEVWSCRGVYRCCFDHIGCCYNYAATYWYVWFLIVLGFLFCLCCFAGCIGMGCYRRRRVVAVHYPATTVVTDTPTTAYHKFPQSQYQPYTPPKEAPPPPYSPPHTGGPV